MIIAIALFGLSSAIMLVALVLSLIDLIKGYPNDH